MAEQAAIAGPHEQRSGSDSGVSSGKASSLGRPEDGINTVQSGMEQIKAEMLELRLQLSEEMKKNERYVRENTTLQIENYRLKQEVQSLETKKRQLVASVQEMRHPLNKALGIVDDVERRSTGPNTVNPVEESQASISEQGNPPPRAGGRKMQKSVSQPISLKQPTKPPPQPRPTSSHAGKTGTKATGKPYISRSPSKGSHT